MNKKGERMISKESNSAKTFKQLTAVLLTLLFLTPAVSSFADDTQISSTEKPARWYSHFSDLFSELSASDAGVRPKITPHLSFNQGFVSNANLGKAQDDPAWQARLAPGIGISLPLNRLLAEVDYTYGFSTTQGRHTNSNRNTQNFDALMRYQLTEKTTLGASNNIQWSQIPGNSDKMFMLESAIGQVQHEFTDKLMSDTKYTFQYFNDQSESDQTSRENDFNDNGLQQRFDYDITEAIRAAFSFQWNIRDFKKIAGKDYWQIQPVWHVSYDLGPKTTVGGHLGWAYRRFHATHGDAESELVYGANLRYLFGQKLTWLLNYDKKLSDTYDTDFIYREDAETTPLDNFDRNYRVLKVHRIGTKLNYNFNERFSTRMFADFEFTTSDKEDNVVLIGQNQKNDEKTMEIGAGFRYRITRWLAINILYSFGRRFQSDDGASNSRRDYTFHKVTGGVNLAI